MQLLVSNTLYFVKHHRLEGIGYMAFVRKKQVGRYEDHQLVENR